MTWEEENTAALEYLSKQTHDGITEAMNGDAKEPRERLLVLHDQITANETGSKPVGSFSAVSSGLESGFLTRAFWSTVLGYLF